jgi:acylphosphatase
MICLNVLITGKVQGVSFRKTTKQMADVIGIVGTVRNVEENKVEVVAQGEQSLVFKLVDFCHHGPEGARVDKVSITSCEISNHTEFEILF